MDEATSKLVKAARSAKSRLSLPDHLNESPDARSERNKLLRELGHALEPFENKDKDKDIIITELRLTNEQLRKKIDKVLYNVAAVAKIVDVYPEKAKIFLEKLSSGDY